MIKTHSYLEAELNQKPRSCHRFNKINNKNNNSNHNNNDKKNNNNNDNNNSNKNNNLGINKAVYTVSSVACFWAEAATLLYATSAKTAFLYQFALS